MQEQPIKYFDVESSRIKERITVRNSLAFSFLTHIPIVPGHSLICPVRAVDSSDKLTPEEWQAILDLKLQLCQALKLAFDAEGFNFAWNMGECAGQSVPHFHLHVIPRKSGDAGIWQYDPRKFIYRPGSREVSPAEELRQTAEMIRNHI